MLAKQRVYQIWGRFEKIDIEDMFSVRFPISTNHIMVDVLYTREEALWELHKNWSRFSKYEKSRGNMKSLYIRSFNHFSKNCHMEPVCELAFETKKELAIFLKRHNIEKGEPNE